MLEEVGRVGVYLEDWDGEKLRFESQRKGS